MQDPQRFAAFAAAVVGGEDRLTRGFSSTSTADGRGRFESSGHRSASGGIFCLESVVVQLRGSRGPVGIRDGLGSRTFEGQQRLQRFVAFLERTFEFGLARQLFPTPLELQGRDPVGETADVDDTAPRFAVLDAHGGGMGSARELAIVLPESVIHIHGGTNIGRTTGRSFQQVDKT